MKNDRLYVIWCAMKQRCLNRSNPSYPRYGGRGICVCKRWLSYSTFRTWAYSNGYKSNLTIERIDNDGNYKPSNCKWATRREQANNTRKNLVICFEGKSQTLSQWAFDLGIEKGTLLYRLKSGWPLEKAFHKIPKYNNAPIVFQGKKKSLSEWAKHLGLNPTTLFMRLEYYNWPLDKALTVKSKNKYAI